jgi:hypothetical protein
MKICCRKDVRASRLFFILFSASFGFPHYNRARSVATVKIRHRRGRAPFPQSFCISAITRQPGTLATTSGDRYGPVTIIDKNLLFARPHVLSAARVKENWFCSHQACLETTRGHSGTGKCAGCWRFRARTGGAARTEPCEAHTKPPAARWRTGEASVCWGVGRARFGEFEKESFAVLQLCEHLNARQGCAPSLNR